jgi:hypothetical protein
MSIKARVVSAFVPLAGMRHVDPKVYEKNAYDMVADVPYVFFNLDEEIHDMWLWKWLNMAEWGTLPPATPAAPDRYPTPQHFVNSNIVQHNRTRWLLHAAAMYPDDNIFIWLDYGLLKQGDFTGKRIEAKHIAPFVEKVERYYNAGHLDIPFPGIEGPGVVNVTGNCWRFCGSTHVVPRWHLDAIDAAYRQTCCEFIAATQTVPLDLPIWALVEQFHPELPYRWYKAEYDYTQLSNFPEPT